jgi:hypothetical protein
MGLKPGERRYNADKNEWEMKPVKPVAKPASIGRKQQKPAPAKAPVPLTRPKFSAGSVSGKSGVPTGKGSAAKGMADALTKKKPLQIKVNGGNNSSGPMGKGAQSGKSMAAALTKKK